ncbi:porin [Niveibacterium sp.]|uniref:porin n=1 Tax=Niveibacterium sp. TaxID=2017444 RepID=UPI0035B335AF
MRTTLTTGRRQIVCAVALALAGLAATSARADISVSGDVQARVGTMTRSGDWNTGYDNTKTSVDGLFALFLSGTKDLKNGYNIGFNCNTVATTVSGANGGYIGAALPVSHNWDPFFAGQDNYQQNGHGGFSSYGDVNGDSKGPMCNDEVYGTLITPYGRVQVGNIMNPMRLLYDLTTVDPVWGDQRGYYQMSDIRGNALRYGNSFGPVGVELQFQTESNAAKSGDTKSNGYAYTGVVTYDFGNGSLLGAGLLYSDGDFGDKYVTASDGKVNHMSYGFTGKTRLGPVNLAATYHSGYNRPKDFEQQYGSKNFVEESDVTLKATYDIASWSLQGYASFETMKWNTPAAWGAAYTIRVGDDAGKTFNRLKTERVNLDFWALYNLGVGAQPFLRINTINKKFSTPDISSFEADTRATKFEAGWLMHF